MEEISWAIALLILYYRWLDESTYLGFDTQHNRLEFSCQLVARMGIT